MIQYEYILTPIPYYMQTATIVKQEAHLSINDVYFVKDANGVLTHISDNFLEILALFTGLYRYREELINRKMEAVLPRTRNQFFTTLHQDTVMTLQSQHYQTSFHHGAKSIHVAADSQPLFTSGALTHVACCLRYLSLYKIDGKYVFLSHRELQILAGLFIGLSAKVMSQALNISLGTTTTYVNRLKNKMQFYNQVQLLNIILSHGHSVALLNYSQQLFL